MIAVVTEWLSNLLESFEREEAAASERGQTESYELCCEMG